MKAALGVLAALTCAAQSPDLASVLERLERLEKENAALRQQVEVLQNRVNTLSPPLAATPPDAPPQPTIPERVEIAERRIEEQAGIKVEASQRFPVKLTGTVLFNAFTNGRGSAGVDQPNTVSRTPGDRASGITLRQSIVGFHFRGPETFLGGQVSADMFLDFFNGNTDLNNFAPVRIRTGGVRIDWKTRSIAIVQDKPLIFRRDPASFSYIGVSPFTAAGNLWRWQPQVQVEQRGQVGQNTRIRAQAAFYQTSDDSTVNAPASIAVDRRRPGLEGHIDIAHGADGGPRFELGTGFHVSESQIGGIGIPSRIWSLDGLASPHRFLTLEGVFWTGQNVHHFGAFRQGVTIRGPGNIIAVRSRGGWGQATVPFTPRVSLNLIGGVHDDRDSDLNPGAISANLRGAANIMYRLAPNVILTFEAARIRTTFLNGGKFYLPRYDLSLAYLF